MTARSPGSFETFQPMWPLDFTSHHHRLKTENYFGYEWHWTIFLEQHVSRICVPSRASCTNPIMRCCERWAWSRIAMNGLASWTMHYWWCHLNYAGNCSDNFSRFAQWKIRQSSGNCHSSRSNSSTIIDLVITNNHPFLHSAYACVDPNRRSQDLFPLTVSDDLRKNLVALIVAIYSPPKSINSIRIGQPVLCQDEGEHCIQFEFSGKFLKKAVAYK